MGPVVAVIQRGFIDRASEPEFTLGAADVRPATREVSAAGRREVLQPRVMQVLVVLARRSGEVVSKDELVALCWGGRAVSEDAIHRCIGRLRRLSESFEGFQVETLTRVGYRLLETEAAPPKPKPRPGRTVVAGVVAAVAVLGVAAAGWFAWSGRRAATDDESPQVAVEAFRSLTGGPASAALAARLSDGVLAVFQEAGIRADAPGDARRAAWRLGGAVSTEGKLVHARIELSDAATKTGVWTVEFERPAGQEDALRSAIGGAAAEAIYSATEAEQALGPDASPTAVAAFIRGFSAVTSPDITNLSDPLRGFQEVHALAPQSAAAHGYRALGDQYAGFFATGADAARLLAAAQREAETAIQIDPPRAGAAYGALAFIDERQRPHNLVAQEDVLLDGLAHAPKFPFLHTHECKFLAKVGRAQAAFAQCQEAAAMRPFAPPTNIAYARAMLELGRVDWASSYMSRMLPYHPDDLNLGTPQFEIAAFLGPPAAIEAALQHPKVERVPYWPGRPSILLLLRARRTGSAEDAAAAVAALRDAARRRQIDPRHVVMGAAVLGRLDDAFAATQEFAQGLDADPSYLFEPATQSMRRDPRFWEVAKRIGLLQYWRARGIWPDFCSDSTMGVDCARESAAG
jgi:DNA-binding winged helix-turn-helix (wHTH) protein